MLAVRRLQCAEVRDPAVHTVKDGDLLVGAEIAPSLSPSNCFLPHPTPQAAALARDSCMEKLGEQEKEWKSESRASLSGQTSGEDPFIIMVLGTPC